LIHYIVLIKSIIVIMTAVDYIFQVENKSKI